MGLSLLDLIFPRKCVSCFKFGSYLCNDCRDKIKPGAPQICPVCERAAIDGLTHVSCKNNLALDGLSYLFIYKPPISLLLKKLKYQFGTDVKNVILELALNELKNYLLMKRKLTLIPIPLHNLRRNWRGFNQSALLGQEIANKLGWEFREDLLWRIKLKPPQASLKGKARQANVSGIFSTNPKSLTAQLPNVLLFDDVWTTGSTMKEAAKALKKAGVKFVWGITIAR
ncbi:ComF family protein [Candidatus Microgenomates bacterium]|nr:ComF family protein [Candidatus Microgenomates bacterium]